MFWELFKYLGKLWDGLTSFLLNALARSGTSMGLVAWVVMGFLWAWKWTQDTSMGILYYAMAQLQYGIGVIEGTSIPAIVFGVLAFANYVFPVQETVRMLGMLLTLACTLAAVRWLTRWLPGDQGK